jgi:hypothetical protein
MDKKCHRMKAERSLGYTLQCEFPQIRTLYRQGLSERVIADLIYENRPFCSYLEFEGTPRLLEGAVRRALIGNSESDPRNKYGFFYEGLLSKDEYDSYSEKNRQKSAIITTAKNAQNKKGALFQTKDELRTAAFLALEELGLTPWGKTERGVARELKGYGLTHEGIAGYLNQFFHDNKPIRSKSAIGCELKPLRI